MESDVVIVGGGLTGLSLALRLQQEGVDYLLLEARNRFGGRILSQVSGERGESDERHDLGPSWIWPGQPRIEHLVRDFELRVFDQHSEGTLVYEEADGGVRRDINYSTMAGALRIKGGIASVIDAITDVLDPSKTLLSHAVTRIEISDGSFRLTVNTACGEKIIGARRLVLALPPRVIEKTITFEPPLPGNVTDALRAVPTWMAGHAKLVAVYEKPFWRDMGLSGDGISRRGPLAEIHDATPDSNEVGALFGFVGVPAGSKEREHSTLINNALQQVEAMFGAKAADPIDILIKDWANDSLTATRDDQASPGHPGGGMPATIEGMADQELLIISSELATQFGGLLEGALEVSEIAVRRLAMIGQNN
jgi:monoamine oxidase